MRMSGANGEAVATQGREVARRQRGPIGLDGRFGMVVLTDLDEQASRVRRNVRRCIVK